MSRGESWTKKKDVADEGFYRIEGRWSNVKGRVITGVTTAAGPCKRRLSSSDRL